MQIEIRATEGIVILDVVGKINLGEGTMVVRQEIRDQLRNCNKKIILNLAGVTYIDSSGIQELVSSYSAVKTQGGSLVLLNPSHKVEELLSITRLKTIFQIFHDQDEAIAKMK